MPASLDIRLLAPTAHVMPESNPNVRLEAFCDGVFAIALTLLIIDIKISPDAHITTAADLWRTLRLLAPSVFAFVLSFIVIFITWVNHDASLKLVHASSAAFIYANALLLLTVVFIPFPTALLGEFIGTDHAAPAVVLYNSVLAVQAIGWLLVLGAVLKGSLARDEASAKRLRANHRNGYVALALYTLLAVTALWFPLTAAIATTASWIFWLTLSIRMKHA